MRHKGSYSCTYCLRKFAKREFLLQHQNTTHNAPKISKSKGRCPHCGTHFPGDGLSRHLSHERSRCRILNEQWETDALAAGPSRPRSVPHTDISSSSDSSVEPSEPEPSEPEPLGDIPLDEPEQELEAELDQNWGGLQDERMYSPPETPDDESLEEMTDSDGQTVFVERYPNANAGQPIRPVTNDDLPPEYQQYPDIGALEDPENFELAKILMESGVSGRFRNRYLTLKRIKDRMPWKNNRVMLMDIDKLPRGADWFVKPYSCEGSRGVEIAECWMRNTLGVIRRLILDRVLGKKMRWAPERHFTSRKRKSRRRGEIYTGDWLWRLQGEIPDEFASLISVIVSSDETRLTNYAGDKKAHPVYLTVGNIPKRLRRRISSRATILIGYLPTPKLDCEPNAERKRELKRDLFHRCIEDMLAPLTEACKEGGVEMPCADGGVRRIYPVLAAYVADFPEQCKVACVKQTYCPLCTTHPKTRGDPGDSGYRDRDRTLQVMQKEDNSGSAWFTRYGLLPTRPFWESHPHVDIGSFITPDLLHQVHKGVMKDHLIKWVTTILGKSAVDERYMSMPEAHGLRHFKSGISSVSQWTGRELKEMVKVLLPALSDSDPRVVRAARSLMDFMYLAHAGSVTDEDLDAMEDALRTFHEHKDVFKELGAVTTDKGFHGIPKLHMISHYTHLIRELGTPDGYNTETSERLHIDFAKMGYRASNKVNATKQMALYIQRLEAIAMHASYLEGKQEGLEEGDPDEEVDPDDEEAEFWDAWLDEDEDEEQRGGEDQPEAPEAPEDQPEEPVNEQQEHELEEMDVDISQCVEWDVESNAEGSETFYPSPEIVVAKTPTWKRVSADDIIRRHGATDILPTLRSHLARTAPQYQDLDFEDGDYRFDVWSRARLFHPPPPFKPSEDSSVDVVRAQPAKYDRYHRLSRPARFDTVLVLMRDNVVGLHRYRPARVRVIFRLPDQIRHVYPGHLAFVELFNYCSANPVEPTGLFTTNHSNHEGRRVTAIIPLSSVRMTCHLAPKFTAAEQNDYISLRSDTLSTYSKFFINIFSSYFMYELVRHWGQDGMWRRDPDEDEEQDRDRDGTNANANANANAN
ncbi:hypothetical protein V565_233860, partial [Rhizoctonia solani 123E]